MDDSQLQELYERMKSRSLYSSKKVTASLYK